MYDMKDPAFLIDMLADSKLSHLQDSAAYELRKMGVLQVLSPVGVIFAWQYTGISTQWHIAGIHPDLGVCDFTTNAPGYTSSIGGKAEPSWENRITWHNRQRAFSKRMHDFLLVSKQAPDDLRKALVDSAHDLTMFFEPLDQH